MNEQCPERANAMTSPNELSFLPEDYLEQKARRRANILCFSLSGVVLVVIGATFMLSERSNRDEQARNDRVTLACSDAAKRIEQVKQMHEQQRAIVQHAELAASLVEKVPRSNVLAELTNALPTGVSLMDFTLDSKRHMEQVPVAPSPGASFETKRAALETGAKAGTAPQPLKYDVHMRFTGIADTDVQVAQYITRLNQCPLFKDVNLVIAENFDPQEDKDQRRQTLRKFQIDLAMNPDAEVGEIKPLMKTAAVELK
jgi:Tfp pilus assembly protein PilN